MNESTEVRVEETNSSTPSLIDMPQFVVQAQGLSKSYGSFKALDGMTFGLPAGRIVGLLGPNGSGKTTLIKILAGLLKQYTGTVTICGKAPSIETKSLVSYLPERTYLDTSMTPKQCMDLFADFYGDFDRQRAEAMLADLGIDTDKTVKMLSKGTQEKMQLVLVMSRRAKLYLLDEPIAGVDPAAREYILRTILNNYDREATILISTHLILDVEPVLDDYVFIRSGKAIMGGTVDDLREQYGKSLDEVFREVFRC